MIATVWYILLMTSELASFLCVLYRRIQLGLGSVQTSLTYSTMFNLQVTTEGQQPHESSLRLPVDLHHQHSTKSPL